MDVGVYNSADFGTAIFVGIGVLILRFIINKSQKNKQHKKTTPNRTTPQSHTSDYVTTSEDAISQMLGNFSKGKDSIGESISEEPTVREPIELTKDNNFKRATNYKIIEKNRSKVAQLVDSNEALRNAVIIQEVLSSPLSKRKR